MTHRASIPDILDWIESPLTALRPLTGQAIRLETYRKDDRYVVLAELPGVDPEKQVEVTVSNGVLTITADREEDTEDSQHSEFRYGKFSRQVALPDGADEEHVQASYDRGILEVVVDIKDTAVQDAQRRIPVRIVGHIKAT